MGRLFSSKLLAKYIQAFGFPEDLRSRGQKILNWCAHFRQQPSLPAERAEFIHDLFVDLLGYKSPFTTDPLSDRTSEWELEFEPEVAIGFFDGLGEKPEIVAKVIWRDWQSSFDGCKWWILIGDRDISLYSCDRDLLSFESFEFESLADLAQLKAFYFLFGRRTLLKGSVKSTAPARLELILAESEALEIENCQEFYHQYQRIRLQLVKDFRYRLQSHELPSESPRESSSEFLSESKVRELAIAQAQKLLNRIVFMTYCDCRILPQGLLRQAYEFHNPYRVQPAWENYQAIFSWLYEGNLDFNPPITGFNLDLFAFDPLLDRSLFVGEELCRQIKELTKFELATDFSYEAIAEILAQILKDLKPLKERQRRFKFSSKNERYKNQLEFSKWLQNLLASDSLGESSAESSSDSEVLSNHLENLLKVRDKLAQVRVFSPKCQTGIALADCLSLLLMEYQRIDRAIAEISKLEIDPPEGTDSPIAQVSSQIYGCDLDPEAIEITKLQLYLRILAFQPTPFSVKFHLEVAEHNQCFTDLRKLSTSFSTNR
jgi:hypothetical protein